MVSPSAVMIIDGTSGGVVAVEQGVVVDLLRVSPSSVTSSVNAARSASGSSGVPGAWPIQRSTRSS